MLQSKAKIHHSVVKDKRGNVVSKPNEIMRLCSPEASSTDKNISLR